VIKCELTDPPLENQRETTILLIASRKDVAAMNIANQLISNHGFAETSERTFGNPVYIKEIGNGRIAKLAFIDVESVDAQSLCISVAPRLLVFLSRHRSESGTPTLSVHTPGNLGEAVLGGLPSTVSVSPASSMKEALKSMKKRQEEMSLEYEVSYECTHHGPSLAFATMFLELGSSPMQWGDSEAAEAVARGALAAVSRTKSYPAVLGIGGPHYNSKFTKVALNTETAFGHIVPKYAVRTLDTEVLRQCIDRTVEPVTKVVLDWKGIKGDDKDRLLRLLRDIGTETVKI